jgi:hypothetical protein
MPEKSSFIMIGDERDIPMALGLIVMVWNACEIELRHMLSNLGSKGNIELRAVVEPLISELGSVGITQALSCYAHELPQQEHELSSAILHAARVVETSRAYRNYYVHSISGVTRYGIDFSPGSVENDTPLHEAMTNGPFAKVYAKTAKGKQKFFLDFISAADLTSFNNYLAEVHDYLTVLHSAVNHYFRKSGLANVEGAHPPKPLRMLPPLAKPNFDFVKSRPALAPWPQAPEGNDEWES